MHLVVHNGHSSFHTSMTTNGHHSKSTDNTLPTSPIFNILTRITFPGILSLQTHLLVSPGNWLDSKLKWCSSRIIWMEKYINWQVKWWYQFDNFWGGITRNPVWFGQVIQQQSRISCCHQNRIRSIQQNEDRVSNLQLMSEFLCDTMKDIWTELVSSVQTDHDSKTVTTPGTSTCPQHLRKFHTW